MIAADVWQVVDFGTPPPRGAGYADVRPGINGMDFAQLYERSWFVAFDPALDETAPVHPRCYTAAAIARSPMRCTGAACPYPGGGRHGGCAVTDERGDTRAPSGWPYSKLADGTEPPRATQERRCLAKGCLTSGEPGSAAWAGPSGGAHLAQPQKAHEAAMARGTARWKPFDAWAKATPTTPGEIRTVRAPRTMTV